MSTKVINCPWCQATNLTSKLAARNGRCRSCARDVAWGIAYLKQRAAERRKAKTKAERAALAREDRKRPEYRERQAALARQRRMKAAHRALDAAWNRVEVSVEERDPDGVVRGARALARALRAIAAAKRLAVRNPSTLPTTAARAIILPEKEDA